MRKFFKILIKSVLWLVGVWAVLLITLEVVLSSSVLTGLINKYATEYVDGDLKFGKASVSMFRRFPNVTVSLEDFSITYPADRFGDVERAGESDTLAYFRRFTAALNVPALATGVVRVPYVGLDKPRIFAHVYADGKANWDIFGSPEEACEIEVVDEAVDEAVDSASASGGPLKLDVGMIRMTGRPHIVYSSVPDSIFAVVNMRRFELRGNMTPKHAVTGKVGLTLDSMFVAGRIGLDTLALGLDRFYIHEEGRQLTVDLAAKTFAALNGYDRMMIPITVNGNVDFPRHEDGIISVKDFCVNVASLPLYADADIQIEDEGIWVDGGLRINRHNIRSIIDGYAVNIMPELSNYSTDVFVELDTKFNLSTKDRMDVNATIKKFAAEGAGVKLDVKASVDDALGEDPAISLDGNMNVALDALNTFVPDSLGLDARGVLTAQIKAAAKLSQLNLYNFSSSSLTGSLTGKDIEIKMPNDSIHAVIDGLDVVLGPEVITVGKEKKKTVHLVGVTGKLAKADVSYKDALKLKVEDLLMSARNSMDSELSVDTLKVRPFAGEISAKKLVLVDSQGSSFRLTNSTNRFSLMPKRGQADVPAMTISSRNERIFLASKYNRASLVNANLRTSVVMNGRKSVDRKPRMMAGPSKMPTRLPSGMPPRPQPDELRSYDIDISLDKTLAKYFREFELSGGLDVERGMVITPYFPLRNSLKGFELKFNNDEISVNKFDVAAGKSVLSATGSLTGLKRALLGRKGSLKLNVDVASDSVDASQLLKAYTSGMNFVPKDFNAAAEDMTDEQFMDLVEIDTSEVVAAPSLIVVPGNLQANINIDASNITYSDLLISKAKSSLVMKDRCVQIAQTSAHTNMGDISLEGFYSTRSKTDLKTGFSLNFKDITAERVINLMPSIDTIMPLLKSFGGLLNCEVAATAQLDTNMNIIMPSLNGIIRMGGENLTISDNDMFKKLASVLMFRNKKKGQIDKMTVEGVIKDSKLEVFPFILEMDRYMLGLSGVQNMDMSFRYHASLIKSPLLVKLGMDIYGQDFDNMKFKLGKAKYKSREVPVFSDVIDDTKINLVESIRHVYDRGVDSVMKENQRMMAIEEFRKKIGYVQAVDQKMEELSAEEQAQLENNEN